ncbi:MAG: helix-turn-helix domain-containing protein [Terriglobales bacterium]
MSELIALPSVKAPVKVNLRTPLSRAVEAQLESKRRLYVDPLVSLKEAQVAFGGVCYSTLRRWIREGILPVVRVSKRSHIKVRTSAIQELLDRGERNGQG